MPIRYSYTQAARRLLNDAEILWNAAGGTRETSAHLAGLSAECVLKSILIGLGIAVTLTDGQLRDRGLRRHINASDLWSEFQSALSGRDGAAYQALLPAQSTFSGWGVDHRYVASQHLPAADLERWYDAAVMMGKVLDCAAERGHAQP
jgi:hypothetical protein